MAYLKPLGGVPVEGYDHPIVGVAQVVVILGSADLPGSPVWVLDSDHVVELPYYHGEVGFTGQFLRQPVAEREGVRLVCRGVVTSLDVELRLADAGNHPLERVEEVVYGLGRCPARHLRGAASSAQ